MGTVYAEHGFSVRCLRGPELHGHNEYDLTATIDDGSCATLYENALVLSSIEVDLSTTTLTAADGSATLTVTAGTPTSLTLTGINGAADYTIAQPGAIDGIAAGSYSVTATDANSCTSNTLMLIMPYSSAATAASVTKTVTGFATTWTIAPTRRPRTTPTRPTEPAHTEADSANE